MNEFTKRNITHIIESEIDAINKNVVPNWDKANHGEYELEYPEKYAAEYTHIVKGFSVGNIEPIGDTGHLYAAETTVQVEYEDGIREEKRTYYVNTFYERADTRGYAASIDCDTGLFRIDTIDDKPTVSIKTK